MLFSWRGSSAAAPQESWLSQAYDLAVHKVEENQGPEGYWPTLATRIPVFHDARPEVNTFLQPIMIALLQPLTDAAGLKETLERARDYTGKQLDETGLVRFSPSFDPLRKAPALCQDMTPDADDSTRWSSVWVFLGLSMAAGHMHQEISDHREDLASRGARTRRCSARTRRSSLGS